MSDSCDLLCLDLDQAEALRHGRLAADVVERAADRARALADPTRLKLAVALRGTELCVCDLAWVLEKSQNLVSHHARALRGAGLARSRREGKLVMYSLTAAGETLVASVLDAVEVSA